jgi:hypothetical protein
VKLGGAARSQFNSAPRLSETASDATVRRARGTSSTRGRVRLGSHDPCLYPRCPPRTRARVQVCSTRVNRVRPDELRPHPRRPMTGRQVPTAAAGRGPHGVRAPNVGDGKEGDARDAHAAAGVVLGRLPGRHPSPGDSGLSRDARDRWTQLGARPADHPWLLGARSGGRRCVEISPPYDPSPTLRWWKPT